MQKIESKVASGQILQLSTIESRFWDSWGWSIFRTHHRENLDQLFSASPFNQLLHYIWHIWRSRIALKNGGCIFVCPSYCAFINMELNTLVWFLTIQTMGHPILVRYGRRLLLRFAFNCGIRDWWAPVSVSFFLSLCTRSSDNDYASQTRYEINLRKNTNDSAIERVGTCFV